MPDLSISRKRCIQETINKINYIYILLEITKITVKSDTDHVQYLAVSNGLDLHKSYKYSIQRLLVHSTWIHTYIHTYNIYCRIVKCEMDSFIHTKNSNIYRLQNSLLTNWEEYFVITDFQNVLEFQQITPCYGIAVPFPPLHWNHAC